jgi:transcriptional regulator with XRE-family HTH domain
MAAMIGERIRAVRQSQQLSLNQVAGKADISVATLSRIETSKQALDIGLFLLLARILKTAPQNFLDENGDADDADPLVGKITSLNSKERTHLWRELTIARRNGGAKRAELRNMNQQVEELLAQVDFLRGEIESVQRRVKRR